MSNTRKMNTTLYMPEQEYDQKVFTLGHVPNSVHLVTQPHLIINNNTLVAPYNLNVHSNPGHDAVVDNPAAAFQYQQHQYQQHQYQQHQYQQHQYQQHQYQQHHIGHLHPTPGQLCSGWSLPQDLVLPAAPYQQYTIPSACHPTNTLLSLTSEVTPYGYGPIGAPAPGFGDYDDYQQVMSRESSLLSSPMSIATEDAWPTLASAHLSPMTATSSLTSLSCSPFIEQQDLSTGFLVPVQDCSQVWSDSPTSFESDFSIQSQATTPYSMTSSGPSRIVEAAEDEPSTPTLTEFVPQAPKPQPAVPNTSIPSKTSSTSIQAPVVATPAMTSKPSKSITLIIRNHATKTTSRKPRPTFSIRKSSGRSQEGPPKPWELEVFRLKEQGKLTYEQIQPIILEKFQEEKRISTLRGAYRKLKLPKELRPRAAHWEDHNYTALFAAVRQYTVRKGPNSTRVRWQRVAEEIREGNFRPGANAVHKVYDEKRKEMLEKMERQNMEMMQIMQSNGFGRVVPTLGSC